MSPAPLHAVGIDHVRALETIALAISRPEPVLGDGNQDATSFRRSLGSELLSILIASRFPFQCCAYHPHSRFHQNVGPHLALEQVVLLIGRAESEPSAIYPRPARYVCLFGTANPHAIEQFHSALNGEPEGQIVNKSC